MPTGGCLDPEQTRSDCGDGRKPRFDLWRADAWRDVGSIYNSISSREEAVLCDHCYCAVVEPQAWAQDKIEPVSCPIAISKPGPTSPPNA